MGHPGSKPQKKVRTDWSPSLAYAVGLIATDGCLSSDGRHIDFTSKDRSLVETFRHCLKLNNKIGKKMSGSTGRSDAYHVQFGDVNFYRWLFRIGISPRKSKTIGRLKIPKRYFWDFLRGCFDGDGSIYSYWDQRWHSSYMFYLKFSSASVAHLQWLQKTIHQLSGVMGKIKLAARCHELLFAKRATRALFNKMFRNDTVPHLKRKLEKAYRIFKIEDTHNCAQVEESADS